MSQDNSSALDVVIVQIKTRWTHLTEDDLHQGLKHRDTFLQRLCHRHSLGMEEAENQLRAFEKKNPGVVFERY